MGFNSQLGANASSHSRAHAGGSLTFSDLPDEMKMAVVKTDPDAAFALIDTSRGLASLVFSGPLSPLLVQFSDDPAKLRSFLKSALRTGKSPAQIVRLAEIFGELSAATPATVRLAAKYLVELGMLTPRMYNAMCPSILHLLCRKDTLTFSFTRRFPLVSEDELCQHRSMGEPHAIEGTDNHLTELDVVILKFGATIGKDNIVPLGIEQLRERKNLTKPLIRSGTDSPETTAKYAVCDATLLGLTLKRYFPASDLRVITQNPALPDGSLHRLAFADGKEKTLAPCVPTVIPKRAGRKKPKRTCSFF